MKKTKLGGWKIPVLIFVFLWWIFPDPIPVIDDIALWIWYIWGTE